jgi:hypothetical protein
VTRKREVLDAWAVELRRIVGEPAAAAVKPSLAASLIVNHGLSACLGNAVFRALSAFQSGISK